MRHFLPLLNTHSANATSVQPFNVKCTFKVVFCETFLYYVLLFIYFKSSQIIYQGIIYSWWKSYDNSFHVRQITRKQLETVNHVCQNCSYFKPSKLSKL